MILMSDHRKACVVRKMPDANGGFDVNVDPNELKKPENKLNFYIGIAAIFVVPTFIFLFVFYSPIGVSLIDAGFAPALTWSLIGLFMGIGVTLIAGVFIIVKARKR